MSGTLVPASKALYFPPLRPPQGSLSPIFSLASSSYPSSRTGPLSDVKRIRVWSCSPLSSRAAINAPTCQSSCAIISPRGPKMEEHTSELQSRGQLVCRLLLDKKKDSLDD